MSSAPQPDLPQDYYLGNFTRMVNHVRGRYQALLSDDELGWIRDFDALPHPARCLCVRLLSRKGPVFRTDKLRYPEIDDLAGAISLLRDAGMIHSFQPHDWSQLAPWVTKAELLHHAPCGQEKLRKPQLVVLLDQQALPVPPMPLIALSQPELLETLLLLYFGNAHQDLAQFVVSDLGIQVFEDYSLDPSLNAFEQRPQLEAARHLSRLNKRYHQAVEQKDRAAILALIDDLPLPLPWDKWERRRQRLLLEIAREFERAKQPQRALALYQHSPLAPSRERQARLHLSADAPHLARPLVQAMLDSPQNEQELTVARRLGKKLNRLAPFAFPQPVAPQIQQHTLSLRDKGLPVEQLVAEHYRSLGWQADYSENALLNALFGLAFWPAIFAPVRGAFLNPYQLGPKDMFSPGFRQARGNLIDHLLCHWQPAQLLETYDQKRGIANYWVNWDKINRPLIQSALTHLSRPQLTACFRRLLFDLNANRSGHPDLFLTRDDQHLWLEVKGPGDTLRDNQTRWLTFFGNQGIQAAVCYVTIDTQPSD
ncbi:VRR-NUC domain-containing protein [Ferrimonas sp. SCSIO 43195]|uniref:VRR-NUC domain-containing protein n=1 Tax=Ferrimonas sp. SCSIO 43195 TaxID=2822844 RepID=UPI0020763278|nr:VRR-NUC domain-containing protein [Ferrimonas sp. SCSIO 43195]USD39339.1 VRR-NUC domain-containing protein [Ferrimonas sp. SCSIO 43195]